MNLIIDIGNTRVKAAVFEVDRIKEVFVFSKEEIVIKLKKIIKNFSISSSIVSSVSNLSEKTLKQINNLLNPIFLNSEIKVPFKNNYETPKTLGVDRIALVAAATKVYPQKNVLIIDAGTCITFDFVNKGNEYVGGAISLGIAMRYRALHDYTAKLPLLDLSEVSSFIGVNTNTSIHSGVVNGVINEIEGVINQYQKKYTDLTIVLTGGDTYFLAKQLKSGIFAHPNFVLEGLHTVLTYNLGND